MPVKAVPSLQVAVTVFVSCARIAPIGSKSPATSAIEINTFRIRTWFLSRGAGHQYQPEGMVYATDLYLARTCSSAGVHGSGP